MAWSGRSAFSFFAPCDMIWLKPRFARESRCRSSSLASRAARASTRFFRAASLAASSAPSFSFRALIRRRYASRRGAIFSLSALCFSRAIFSLILFQLF